MIAAGVGACLLRGLFLLMRCIPFLPYGLCCVVRARFIFLLGLAYGEEVGEE